MVRRFGAAAAAGVFFGILPALARAQGQVDTNPPKPNVLLLLDNSGSMERMIDGTPPEASPANTCNCDATSGQCNWTQTPQPNRWNVVQQALTGSLTNGFNCVAMPRTPGSTFADEYQIAGNAPYDINYYLPFHRMVAQDSSTSPSTACVVAPGALPGAITPGGVGPNGIGLGGKATDFVGSIVSRPYGQERSSSSTCTFAQLPNGALSTMTDLMRFGLMTFDQDPSPATGVILPGLTVANPAFTGMWTYYPGWNTGAPSTIVGSPAGCSAQTQFAVGARNPAAPPWEGRMVQFPSKDDLTSEETTNAQVGSVVLASRPYGATPMAGMMSGAKYYFTLDPAGPQQSDPYVQGGCRNEYVILLTDGAPNDDMRPDCSNPNLSPAGQCPFPELPEEYARDLYSSGTRSGSQQFVTTYVVGFAVSSFQDQGTTVYCSSLAVNGSIASQCMAPSAAAAPCCELQKIATMGGSNQAYFADTPGDLQKALGSILADIAKQATTRTVPVYSPTLSSIASPSQASTPNASTFLASFNPAPGQPWSGDLQRQRFQCTPTAKAYTVTAQPVTATLGDDFAQDLNSGAGPARTYIAVEPALVQNASVIDSTASIRPYAQGAHDGLGVNAAKTVAGNAATIISQLTPDALGIPTTGPQPGCPYTPSNAAGQAFLTPDQCKAMLLDFTFGQPFTGPSNFALQSRAKNAFGDVFHASPAVVGPPSSLLQDPSYTGFSQTWSSNVPANNHRGQGTKARDTIAYVATNDGLLHAFWADETKLEDNEEWAFLPPAVMPNLLSSYPSSHQFLLDGTPIVKDVVWQRVGALDPSVWHTMLVAGFGPYERGYYALDVTNPDPSGLAGGSSLTPPGPSFRWQLTKMPATNYPVFADHSATPAITTLYIDSGDGIPKEVGVAILPGGVDHGGPTSSASGGPACARAAKASDAQPALGAYPARASVRCWGPNQKATDMVSGRSVSVVNIATGEILRVFTRKADVNAFPNDTLALGNLVTDTALDSPMTGTPVVYPSDIGTVATKAFVGDEDGTLWRFDLSSPHPSDWVGELYFDTYNTSVDPSSTNWADGQPFDVPLVASLDTAGELVLDVATGNVELFDSAGSNYLYSITERVQGSPAKLRASVNWYLGPQSQPVALRPGERVSGPMTVFDSTLYFATYWAGNPSVASCNGGSARLWGFDFVTPRDPSCATASSTSCDRSQGGLRELLPPTRPDFIDPTQSPYNAPAGAVIPGVTIQASPSCASVNSGSSNPYFGNSTSNIQKFTAGTFSLQASVGAKGTGSAGLAVQQVSLSLPTPSTPTIIDSWAAVLE